MKIYLLFQCVSNIQKKAHTVIAGFVVITRMADLVMTRLKQQNWLSNLSNLAFFGSRTGDLT